MRENALFLNLSNPVRLYQVFCKVLYGKCYAEYIMLSVKKTLDAEDISVLTLLKSPELSKHLKKLAQV